MVLKSGNEMIEKQKNCVIDIGRFARGYEKEGNLQSHVTEDSRSEPRLFSSYLSLSTTLGNSKRVKPRPTHSKNPNMHSNNAYFLSLPVGPTHRPQNWGVTTWDKEATHEVPI